MSTRFVVRGMVLVAALCMMSTSGSALSATVAARSATRDVLEPRVWPATTWVDGRYFVFGGHRRAGETDDGDYLRIRIYNDGALFDPANADATPLPSAPFRPALYQPVALTDGKTVVVVGTQCSERVLVGNTDVTCTDATTRAASYDVAKRRWRRIAAPELRRPTNPGSTRAVGVLPDGRMVFAITTTTREYWTLDPASGALAQLPPPPANAFAECVRDNQVIALTHSVGERRTAIAVLDTTDATGWDEGPIDPITPEERPELHCMDHRVLLTRGLFNRIYDITTRQWSWPSSAPGPSLGDHAVWTGQILAFVDYPIRYNPTTDTWDFDAFASPQQGWRRAEARFWGFGRLDRTGVWNGVDLIEYRAGNVVTLPTSS